ncbi:hypothetical protein ABMA28_005732 [Loxostege sticticalis]|uniref:Uncharacterized protein n=1 Tax=Loxostege sticticalis TaxID=481309 RepID=A0ABD0SMP3_LOXSC
MLHLVERVFIHLNFASRPLGEFKIEWKNLTLCRGPKARNLSDISTALNRYENGTNVLFMNVSLPNNIIIHEAKTLVHELHGEKKSLLWNYKVSEACKHFFFAQIIRQHLNSSDCHVKKGFYSIKFNLNQLISIFYGKSFYYGDYLFNLIIATRQGNILCLSYGDYITEWKNFTLCRGPKARNLSDISTVLNRYENGTYVLFMNVSLPNDIKISVHELNEVTKIKLWNYKVSEACKYFFFAQIIRQHLNSSNCHVKKGFYSIEFNLNRLVRSYLGNRFYYGEFLLNLVVATRQGNILCLKYVLSFKKKTIYVSRILYDYQLSAFR